jgi:hypothetical protein
MLLETCGRCNCCQVVRSQNTKSAGYQNLKNHLINCHKGWEADLRHFMTGRGPMDAFLAQVSDKAKSVYGWLDWIIDGANLLLFVNKIRQGSTPH